MRAPGEVITKPALDYLTSGVEAGMLIPDAADASSKTFRGSPTELGLPGTTRA